MAPTKLVYAVVLGSASLIACTKSGSAPEPETAVVMSDPAPSATDDAMDPFATPTGGAADPALEPGPIGATGPAPASTTASTPPTPLTDGQIVMVAETVDKGEIAQAKEVQKRAKNPQVRKLAGELIQHHTKSKQKAQTLVKKAQLTPADSAVASELTAKSEESVQTIKSAAIPADAERAYVDAQVQQHEALLELLNTRLIPDAINADLKAQLEETRKIVEGHIEQARKVQQAIADGAAAAPPAG